MKKEFNFSFLNKIMYIATAIIIFYIIKDVGLLDKVLEVNTALIPVYIGILICFVSMPLAKKLTQLKLNKAISAIISLVIIYGIIAIIFAMVIPVFVEQLTGLINNFPELYKSIANELNTFISNHFSGIAEDIKLNSDFSGLSVIQNYLTDVVTYSINTIQSMFNFLISIFTTIIVSFFLVKDMEDIKKNATNIFSNGGRNKGRVNLIKEIDSSVMSYVKGITIDSVIVGILTTIVCMVLKLDYAIVFGILITILNFIPYIGALLSEVIIALYALTIGGPMFALLTFLLLVVVQIIDANILQPNIVAKSVDLHPIIVFVGLIVGNILMGIVGMIIVVPVCAIIKIIINYKMNKLMYNVKIKEESKE